MHQVFNIKVHAMRYICSVSLVMFVRVSPVFLTNCNLFTPVADKATEDQAPVRYVCQYMYA